jgi:RHS repeat-associated protein
MSVSAITNSGASVVERYAYDAYGCPTITDGAGNPVSPNAWGTPHSVIGNPYLFTGRELDEETGLYYYRARFYDCAKGRFLQRDPLEYVRNVNLYEFVEGNPSNLLDPLGWQAQQCPPPNPCAPLYGLYNVNLRAELLRIGIAQVSAVLAIGGLNAARVDLVTQAGGTTFITPAMTRLTDELAKRLIQAGVAAGAVTVVRKALNDLAGVPSSPQKACFALAICESALGRTSGKISHTNVIAEQFGNEVAKCVWKNGRATFKLAGLRYRLPKWLGGWDWVEPWEADP